MNYVTNIALVTIVWCTSTGCAPDLVVKSMDVTWDSANRKQNAFAIVENIGKGDAGNFIVYFNADENPAPKNYGLQVSHTVPSLAKGESITLYADFLPLAHPDNNNLDNVYKIRVIADPTNMVKESDENNVEKETLVPMADLVITDIIQDGPYFKVTYKNIGVLRDGDFLIKITNNTTADSFAGNPYYRYIVPAPNKELITGGLGFNLIGLQKGDLASITAEIDWEQRVDENYESNNIFTKKLRVK